jgi:predicted deacylase
MNTKNIIIALVVLVIIGIAGFLLTQIPGTSTVATPEPTAPGAETPSPTPSEPTADTPAPEETPERDPESILGTSVGGNEVVAYHFGDGDTEILFVGGIHGGYSWNTTLLAYELVDYLDANPNAVPDSITVTVIPAANPDGLKKTLGTAGRFSPATALAKTEAERVAGRFNGNTVDLNRNFDCGWNSEGTWQNRTVSGGDNVFSEPEAAALRDYIEENEIAAAVVWFSAEGKVYPSACGGSPSDESVTLAATFATAAKYPAGAEFDAYAITGDMVNWMAKENIPAISVLLTDHTNTEWSKNKAGVEAVLKSFAE